MLRIGGRAAIAARHDFAVAPETLHHALGRRGNRSRQRVHALQFEMRAFRKVLADAVDQIHCFIMLSALRSVKRGNYLTNHSPNAFFSHSTDSSAPLPSSASKRHGGTRGAPAGEGG